MTTSVAEAGQRLLQDDQTFDVAVLDGIVAAAYEPRHPERATANETTPLRSSLRPSILDRSK